MFRDNYEVEMTKFGVRKNSPTSATRQETNTSTVDTQGPRVGAGGAPDGLKCMCDLFVSSCFDTWLNTCTIKNIPYMYWRLVNVSQAKGLQ